MKIKTIKEFVNFIKHTHEIEDGGEISYRLLTGAIKFQFGFDQRTVKKYLDLMQELKLANPTNAAMTVWRMK